MTNKEFTEWLIALDGRVSSLGQRVCALEAATAKPAEPDAKPADCPWCGEAAGVPETPAVAYAPLRYYIYCGECSGQGPTCKTVPDAIAAWNKVAKRD